MESATVFRHKAFALLFSLLFIGSCANPRGADNGSASTNQSVIAIEYAQDDFWNPEGFRLIHWPNGQETEKWKYGFNPDISPDGVWLAYNEYLTINSEIRLGILISRLSDRSQPATLVVDSAGDPTWSPKGQSIAYFADEGGIYVINIECILMETNPCNPDTQFVAKGQSFGWSPTAELMIYETLEGSTGQHIVTSINLQTGETSTVSAPGYADCRWPDWSPDGKSIAMSCRVTEDEPYDIFLIAWDSGSITNLTFSPLVSETNPRWSPDASHIIFLSQKDSDLAGQVGELLTVSNALYSINIEDGNVVRITGESNIYIIDIAWWTTGCEYFFSVCE